MDEEANVQGTSIAPDASPSPDSALPSTSSHQQQQQLDYGTPEIIDTAAPIDSVMGAVTKFGAGAVLDWREKRKQVQDELDTVQEETTRYERRAQEAEAGRAGALRELGTAVAAADELGLGLDKARAEQAHARQQADLAELRLEETRRAASERAAAELDAALEDLRAARAEAESLEKVRARAAAEAGKATARAREAAAASRDAGSAVEDLAGEVVALKAELESSRAAHVAAEEKRMGLAVAWEEDKSRWQTELEEAEMEAKRLREELMAACDVEMKVEAVSELLASLEAQLSSKPTVSTRSSSTLELEKELDDVKASVEKAKDEAGCLRVAAASLRGELEKEKAELTALRRRESERERESSELRRATSELAAAEAEAGGDERRKMAERRVGEARREAEEAKAKARAAREEVARAREDAGVAKAAAAATEARLVAVAREIVAANTAAEIATASAGALLLVSEKEKEKEKAAVEVTLTAAEYGELSRRARETEEAAGVRVVEAVKLIKEAKDAEVRSLEKMARQAKQTQQRRQALEASTLEAEEAEFQKLSAERELRQWHAGSPRPGLAEISVLDHPAAGDGRANPHILSPRGGYMPLMAAAAADADADARQKKTFLPRMVMFLARRKAQAQTWK